MSRKKKRKHRFDGDTLRQLLHQLWLVADWSIMAGGIEQVVKAYSEGQRVKVVVQEGANSELITNTLKALGIYYGDETISSYGRLKALTSTTNRSSKKVRLLRVPTLADRVEDFGLLLPFAYELAKRIPNGQQGKRIDCIEGGFILSVLVLLKFGRYSLLEIMEDAIGCAEDGVIWGAGSLDIDKDPREVSKFFGNVTPAAGAYLGIGDRGSHEDTKPRGATELYPPAEMKQLFSSAIDSGVPFKYPRLDCPVKFEPENLGLVARNFGYWYRRPDMSPNNPALLCLKLRLWGWSEDEIYKAIINGDVSEYEERLAENHIDLTSVESREVLKDWEMAEDQLLGDQRNIDLKPEDLLSDIHRVMPKDTESLHTPFLTGTPSKKDQQTERSSVSAGNYLTGKLDIFENGFCAIYDKQKYRFRRKTKKFEALVYMARKVKDENPFPDKYDIATECNIPEKQFDPRKRSIRNWFILAGGDPKKFARKFLTSDNKGGCGILIDPELIEIHEYEFGGDEEEDSDD